MSNNSEVENWNGSNIRLVVYAWGEKFVNLMLEKALASAMSPGNIPYLSKHFKITVAVVTEELYFDYVKKHLIIKKIQEICDLKLISIDQLLAEPWQYGIVLTNSLFAGFEDLGEEMLNTFILYLNADFILADNSYRKLIPYIKSGKRAIFSPSYCVNEEDVNQILNENILKNNGLIKIENREMAEIILQNRHMTIKAKTLSKADYHFTYYDQFYWEVNINTLIGYQMPIALIGMRPEKVIRELEAFWDWGVIKDFCPTEHLYEYICDSDTFLMLELREKNKHSELVLAGKINFKTASKNLSGHITNYQIQSANNLLILHSKDLPGNLDESKRLLEFQKNKIVSKINYIRDNKNHKQWQYHKAHYDKSKKIKNLKDKIQNIEKEINLINDLNNKNSSDLIKYLEKLKKELNTINSFKEKINYEGLIKNILINFLNFIRKNIKKISIKINNRLLRGCHDAISIENLYLLSFSLREIDKSKFLIYCNENVKFEIINLMYKNGVKHSQYEIFDTKKYYEDDFNAFLILLNFNDFDKLDFNNLNLRLNKKIKLIFNLFSSPSEIYKKNIYESLTKVLAIYPNKKYKYYAGGSLRTPIFLYNLVNYKPTCNDYSYKFYILKILKLFAISVIKFETIYDKKIKIKKRGRSLYILLED